MLQQVPNVDRAQVHPLFAEPQRPFGEIPPVGVEVAEDVEGAVELRVAVGTVEAGVEVDPDRSTVLSTMLVLNVDVGKFPGSTRHTRWYSENQAVSSYMLAVHSVSAVML
jgi:hypothetical protein